MGQRFGFRDLLAANCKRPSPSIAFEEVSMVNVQNQAALWHQHAMDLPKHGAIGRFIEVTEALPHADHSVEAFTGEGDLPHVGANESKRVATTACLLQGKRIEIEAESLVSAIGQRMRVSRWTTTKIED